MVSSFKKFKAKALSRLEIRKAYDELAEEFAFLDAVLFARGLHPLTRPLSAGVGRQDGTAYIVGPQELPG